MWNFIKSIAEWPLWNFLSVVLVVWITQRVIAWRERRKKISDTQMELYLSTVAPLSKLYKAAITDKSPVDVEEVYRESLEIMARLAIYGTNEVMTAFCLFSEYVLAIVREGEALDEKLLRQLYSNVTFHMCCDVHGEVRDGTCPVHTDNELEAGERRKQTAHRNQCR